MAQPKLKYSIGNSASTTGSASVTDSDTSFSLTSTTNFQAAPTPGEGLVLMDEGEATEEFGYSTGLSGGALTIPLANRGLEGTSSAGHSQGYSMKGVFTAGMWNDLVQSLLNVLVQSTGAVDTTKIVTPSATQELTNKTIDATSNTISNIGNAQVVAGVPVQVVTATYSAVDTTTALIPWDDSIPQNSEGKQMMTVNITPKSATNTLIVEAHAWIANSGAADNVMAVFKDADANAISASEYTSPAGYGGMIDCLATLTSGGTSQITFNVRLGTDAGTLTLNGNAGNRYLGAITKSWIRVTEVKA